MLGFVLSGVEGLFDLREGRVDDTEGRSSINACPTQRSWRPGISRAPGESSNARRARATRAGSMPSMRRRPSTSRLRIGLSISPKRLSRSRFSLPGQPCPVGSKFSGRRDVAVERLPSDAEFFAVVTDLISFCRVAAMAGRTLAAVILNGRPPFLPLAREAARPAMVRSEMSALSNSARAAKMTKIAAESIELPHQKGVAGMEPFQARRPLGRSSFFPDSWSA